MKYLSIVLAILILPFSFPGSARSDDAVTLIQRSDFVRAERALQKGQTMLFERLASTLVDYPLYPYLLYEQLRYSLKTATPDRIQDFLDRYGDSPLAPRLRRLWLRSLAYQRRWTQLIRFYQPSRDVSLQCYYRRALYKTGQREAALSDMDSLWLVAKSQPRSCDPIFQVWRHKGGLTSDLVWQRIGLAMDAGNISLARYLEHLLPSRDRRWARLWRWVHRQPGLILSEQRFTGRHPQRNRILLYGIQRMALKNPARAFEALDQLKTRYGFSKKECLETERQVGLALASKGRPGALPWLAAIDPDYATGDVGEWRVRSALMQNDWELALAWIGQLPPEQRYARRWRYWSARALEQTGQISSAQKIYAELSQIRSYYGFLAADHMQLPYRIDGYTRDPDAFDRTQLASIPAIRRAHELFKLKRLRDARHEWSGALTRLDNEQIGQMARLAYDWGWHDLAILTAAKTSNWGDIELRFPLIHRTQVIEQSIANNVDPALAFAVIRQESAFNPLARSHHGALGLMQIMPDTARWISETFNFPMRTVSDLYDAKTNIRFGVTYLREMLDNFDDNPVLAIAAYNAGGGRIRRHLPASGTIPADLWIETLPIVETRNYLKHVQAYTTIYQHRLGRSGQSLVLRMPPIQAPAARLSRNAAKSKLASRQNDG